MAIPLSWQLKIECTNELQLKIYRYYASQSKLNKIEVSRMIPLTLLFWSYVMSQKGAIHIRFVFEIHSVRFYRSNRFVLRIIQQIRHQHPFADEKRDSGILRASAAQQAEGVSIRHHQRAERGVAYRGGRDALHPPQPSPEGGETQLRMGRKSEGAAT